MDQSKLKRVGTASDGEPIYELASMSDLKRFDHSCGDPDCLACILNQLIDPAEELEVWMHRAETRLQQLRGTNAIHYRSQLQQRFALASEALANLKGIILTASQIFNP